MDIYSRCVKRILEASRVVNNTLYSINNDSFQVNSIGVFFEDVEVEVYENEIPKLKQIYSERVAHLKLLQEIKEVERKEDKLREL